MFPNTDFSVSVFNRIGTGSRLVTSCFRKHYREYLVSLINGHSIDPAPLFEGNELHLACRRYQVELIQGEAEDDRTYYARLLKVSLSQHNMTILHLI